MTLLDRVRRPEYTGENRCLPCTVVNAVLTVCFAALLVGVGAQAVSATAGLAAGGAFVLLAAALIWLRGYLVPGTPTLTKRYLPRRVLGWFGKEPVRVAGPGPDTHGETEPAGDAHGHDEDQQHADHGHDSETTDDPNGEPAPEEFDPEELLLAADAVEPCEDGEDLCITADTQAAWNEELEALPEPVEPEDALSAIGFDLDALSVRSYDTGTVVFGGGQRVLEWPSDAAMRLDAAGAQLLAEISPDWEDLHPGERAGLVAGLRIFVEDCPDDGGTAELQEETVESCCSEHTVVTLECSGSGDRLVEWQVD